MPNTTRISRKRKELFAQYATAAGNLYGVISMDELVAVFNRYEDEKTDAEELRLGLERLLKTDGDALDYSLFEDLVTGPDFLPSLAVDRHNAKIVRQEQSGKPRYLPDKAEFLRYAADDYLEPQKPYDDLAAYIHKHKLTQRGAGIGDVEGDLLDFREMIQNEDMSAASELEFFQERGYELGDDIDALNAFLRKLMDVHNNTRLFQNNGFTPNEAWKEFAHLREAPPGTMLKPPFAEPEEEVFAKVGRNDLCPCGSGLKYKKCHGSDTSPQNKLSAADTEYFYRLWYGVLAYVNQKYNLTPSVQRDLERNNYKTIDASKIQRPRDRVWETPELIGEYIETGGAKLTADDRVILRDWENNCVQGRFVLMKHLKDYSVFLRFDEEEECALYGVIGLMNSIERLFPRERLPQMVEAVLLPFKGKIIHDSLIASYDMSYGLGAREMFEESYAEQLATAGIVTALEG
ncbi:MAG: SEC-C domain-containing protein [Peptococcaceae bacterium]|jgi:uncharacterized protein YchJ|nr:SEC-C domain-containing protein [Peptococcaceae bacterium]